MEGRVAQAPLKIMERQAMRAETDEDLEHQAAAGLPLRGRQGC
jgi:hypothetical protein